MVRFQAPDDGNVPMEQTAARVASFVRTNNLLVQGQRVLIAVSGGADSMALGLILPVLGWGLRPELAHVDHGWRGEAASEAERSTVRALARKLGVPAHFVPHDASIAKTEEAARTWRYDALAGVLEEAGIDTLATGHHRGDQAETLLMRLLRGSGPWGLAGIRPQRGLRSGRYRVVRPLLDEDPGTLRPLLEASDLTWVEDPSNTDPAFDRARTRAVLQGAPAQAIETLAEAATHLRRELAACEKTLRTTLRGQLVVHPLADAVEVPRHVMTEQRGFWMEHLLRILGRSIHADDSGPWLTQRHVALVRQIAVDGGDLDLPRDLHWHVQGKRAWLWRRPPRHQSPKLEAQERVAGSMQEELASRGPDEVVLDAVHVGTPILRLLSDTDTFSPLGREQPETTSVVAWLKRRGVPRPLRERQWVVQGDQGIAWVVGHRIDRRAALTETSTRCLRLRVHATS